MVREQHKGKIKMKQTLWNTKLAAAVTIAVAVSFAAGKSFAEGVENGVENDDGITNIANAPTLEGKSKIILTVDQRGNLSSTNAVATSAALAAIAASNQLAVAVQTANKEGYSTATNLLNEVALAVASSPIVFCTAELTSFIAATVFDEATAKLRIFEWVVDQSVTQTINIDGTDTECVRITCGYMFTEPIDTLQPLVKYVEHLEDNTDSTTWDYLADTLVGTPTAVTHDSYTDSAGTTFTNFYRMYLWVPKARASGFFRVVVESDAPDGEGNTLDTVGVKDGYTGVVTNGTIVLNIKGGYIMQTGTGTITE